MYNFESLISRFLSFVSLSHLIRIYKIASIIFQHLENLTLFLIFLRTFFKDFSSCFVSGNFVGTGYPSAINVRFSSSVNVNTPVDPFCKPINFVPRHKNRIIHLLPYLIISPIYRSKKLLLIRSINILHDISKRIISSI